MLAHERIGRDGADFLPALSATFWPSCGNTSPRDEDAIEVRLGQHGAAAILEINVELPSRR